MYRHASNSIFLAIAKVRWEFFNGKRLALREAFLKFPTKAKQFALVLNQKIDAVMTTPGSFEPVTKLQVFAW